MIEGIDLLGKRLKFLGGYSAQDRLIKSKERAFMNAAGAGSRSYQACDIEWQGRLFKAMINPDKNKMDYDDKILSVAAPVKAGELIDWVGTNTKWLITLPQLSEKAYFRGSIRRCRYKIQWLDKDDVYHSEWAVVRGPVETKIVTGSKASIAHDAPNETLHILMPDKPENRELFFRYGRFLFQERAWQVQSSDYISTEGILEFTAKEDYLNQHDDLEVANQVTIEKIDPNDNYIQGEKIFGDTFIFPRVSYEYHCNAEAGGIWKVKEDNRPVTLTTTGNRVSVRWDSNRTGQFTLQYTTTNSLLLEKIIVVESMF